MSYLLSSALKEDELGYTDTPWVLNMPTFRRKEWNPK